jgi:porin
VNWAPPGGSGLDDQGTLEAFYKFQVTQALAITPDVQLSANPALNTEDEIIGIFGLRVRLV